MEPRTAAGLVFRTTKEADMFRSIHEPTDAQAILNDWPRVDQLTYFSDPATATGESADWSYDSTQDSFVQPQNSATTLAILSPVKLTSYTFETTLTSPAADDDLIGIALAADVINGEVNILYAWVNAGGLGPHSFFVSFLDPSSGNYGELIEGNDVLASYRNADDGDGWSGKKVKVRAARSGGVINVKCSDWDGSSLLDSTEIEVNLSDLPRNGPLLAEGARYGFSTQSQANSTYLGYTIRSGDIEDNTKVYSEDDNRRWVYGSGSWSQSGTAYDDFSEVDLVRNRLTKEYFTVNSSTLQFNRNEGIDYGVSSLNLPAGTTSSVNFDDIISNYTYDESFTIVGTFDAVNLTATVGTDVIDVTTTSTNGNFYVLFETAETVDPDTNVKNKTIAFRRVDVNVA